MKLNALTQALGSNRAMEKKRIEEMKEAKRKAKKIGKSIKKSK